MLNQKIVRRIHNYIRFLVQFPEVRRIIIRELRKEAYFTMSAEEKAYLVARLQELQQ